MYVLIIYAITSPTPNKQDKEITNYDSVCDNQVLIEEADIEEADVEEVFCDDNVKIKNKTDFEKWAENEEKMIQEENTDSNVSEDLEQSNDDMILVEIIINYEKKTLAYNDDGIIYVDGEEIGRIKAGNTEYYNLYLTKGQHKVWVDSDTTIRQNNTGKVIFSVNDNITNFNFTLKEKMLGLDLDMKK